MAMAEMSDLPDLPTPNEIDDGVLRAFDALDAPEMVPDDEGGFRISDAGQADWALRKLAGVRAKQAETDELAARQIQAIQAMVAPYLEPIHEWHRAQIERLSNDASFWEGMLTLYHRDVVLAEDEKAKTVNLPHGTLSARKKPDQWKFGDEEFMAWARNVAPELIRTKDEVDKALAKKTLKVGQFGEAILDLPAGQVTASGVEVVPGEVTFKIETGEVAS